MISGRAVMAAVGPAELVSQHVIVSRYAASCLTVHFACTHGHAFEADLYQASVEGGGSPHPRRSCGVPGMTIAIHLPCRFPFTSMQGGANVWTSASWTEVQGGAEATMNSGTGAFSGVTFDHMAADYLADYQLQEYRTIDSARGRVENLRRVFGGKSASEITPPSIREYQVIRRQQGMSAASVNRETSGLSRMFRLAIDLGNLQSMPKFPQRLQAPPATGFLRARRVLEGTGTSPGELPRCLGLRVLLRVAAPGGDGTDMA